MVSDVFRPPSDNWRRLDPKFAAVRAIGTLTTNLIIVIPLSVVAWIFLDSPWPWLVMAVGLGWTLWRVLRSRRWARAWGYAERDEDLCITQGLWFRSLTVIPYGRMQLAKVEAGPLQRAFGLATVELVTASSMSNASIPGMPAADATALRDRLIELGDSRSAGL